MNRNEDTHLLSGAYALDAVTPDEAALIEAAMSDSEELRGEITELSDTAVALGLAIPPVSPPPALRARLLDAIDGLPQQTADPVAALVDETAAQATPAMPAGAHLVTRRRQRARRPALFLALAAVAVLLFSGGFLVQRTFMTTESQLTAISQSPDVHTASTQVRGGGTASVYWSKDEHSTAIVLTGTTVPSGKVLQMWTMRNGTTTDAGLYAPADDGNYAVISGTPTVGEQIAITVEPAGGSPKPTSEPIAVVGLRA